jgi:hypothetical protein
MQAVFVDLRAQVRRFDNLVRFRRSNLSTKLVVSAVFTHLGVMVVDSDVGFVRRVRLECRPRVSGLAPTPSS